MQDKVQSVLVKLKLLLNYVLCIQIYNLTQTVSQTCPDPWEEHCLAEKWDWDSEQEQ
jgi:hypothetical protein